MGLSTHWIWDWLPRPKWTDAETEQNIGDVPGQTASAAQPPWVGLPVAPGEPAVSVEPVAPGESAAAGELIAPGPPTWQPPSAGQSTPEAYDRDPRLARRIMRRRRRAAMKTRSFDGLGPWIQRNRTVVVGVVTMVLALVGSTVYANLAPRPYPPEPNAASKLAATADESTGVFGGEFTDGATTTASSTWSPSPLLQMAPTSSYTSSSTWPSYTSTSTYTPSSTTPATTTTTVNTTSNTTTTTSTKKKTAVHKAYPGVSGVLFASHKLGSEMKGQTSFSAKSLSVLYIYVRWRHVGSEHDETIELIQPNGVVYGTYQVNYHAHLGWQIFKGTKSSIGRSPKGAWVRMNTPFGSGMWTARMLGRWTVRIYMDSDTKPAKITSFTLDP